MILSADLVCTLKIKGLLADIISRANLWGQDLPSDVFLISGQYEDAETGLYYNYFRDYDPQIGRYLEADPIGLAGGVNVWGYVLSSPTRFVDLFGLELLYEDLKKAARYSEYNPEIFIKALQRIAESEDILRTADEPYNEDDFIKIADDWCDIPVSIRNYGWDDLNIIRQLARTTGNHPINVRFEGGYHIHTEEVKPGVYLHYDAFDTLKWYFLPGHFLIEVLGIKPKNYLILPH